MALSKNIANRPHRLVQCRKCREWVWARHWTAGRKRGDRHKEGDKERERPKVVAHLYHCDNCVPWEVKK